MNHRVLLIAFHFPPLQGSSGLQRTLSFCRYLPEFGWEPSVLTAHTRAYDRVDETQLSDLPKGLEVKRAFALDSARHLSVGGAYFKATALPDRWVSWCLGAIPAGLRLIRRLRPSVIWSTYPIATAHIIGGTLARITGIPWVADFRDPMVETIARTNEQFPSDATLRNARLRVERMAAVNARRVVFCTDTARAICEKRYSDIAQQRWQVIENGFDESIFSSVESARQRPEHPRTGPMTLLHSGVLYFSKDRNPTAFFDALAQLAREGSVTPARLQVTLRASGNEEVYRRLIRDRRLEDLVRVSPPIPYREALTEMIEADGLLLFQGYTSNPAIPAKAYEYLRTRRPIFALVDEEGETARLIRTTGTGRIVPMEDPGRIAEGLCGFIEDVQSGQLKKLSEIDLQRYSRKTKTQELARLLDQVVSENERLG